MSEKHGHVIVFAKRDHRRGAGATVRPLGSAKLICQLVCGRWNAGYSEYMIPLPLTFPPKPTPALSSFQQPASSPCPVRSNFSANRQSELCSIFNSGKWDVGGVD